MINRFILSLAILPAIGASSFAATPVLSGPPPRAITDPKSVTSAANPEAAPVAIADLFNTRGVADAAWTPDSRKVIISTNITGRYNLWEVPVDGGFPLQLAQSDNRQYGPAVSPDGKTLIFESDFGGAEIYDLFAMPLRGGAVSDITNSPSASENGTQFAPDGKRIFFDYRLSTGASSDIAEMDLATRKVTLLTHETAPGFFWGLVGVTENGRALIANRENIGGTQSTIWRIDTASGHAEALTDTKPELFNEASAVSADGNVIALTTERDGAKQAALMNVASRAVKLDKPDAWEQSSGSLSRDGRTMIFSSNVDGRTDLFIDKNGAIARIDLPPGLNTEARNGNSISPDGARLLVSHQSSNSSADLWTVDLRTGEKKQITRLGLATISPALLPASQLVHYKSEDGTVISAFLWMPFNLKRDGKAPGIVYPHGGPTGQTMDYFDRAVQALATRGYAVIAPNVRGSTGYGRAFMEANRMDLGGGDLTDEVYAAKFLAATGYIDPKKIGITGGSYGGYMTLMAIGKTPDIWAAGVEEYGIIDWLTMLEHSEPPLQQYEKGLLGDPVKDKAVYVAASPLAYIDKVKAPLLVLQGDNDIRVPKQQAQMVVDKLKARGATVDAHFYPEEGHGFAKREDQIDSIDRMVAWFDKYLKGGT